MRTLVRAALVFLTLSFSISAADRVVDPVDPSRIVTLPGQRNSQAVAQNDRGPADPTIELRYITLLLRPAPGLESLLASQQDPT